MRFRCSLSASREYDAFGTIIPNSTTGTWPGRFGYQGESWQEIFSANGSQRILLSSARLYDPATGRFLQPDPLYRSSIESQRLYRTVTRLDSFSWEDLNLYQYVGNSPIDRVDPEGLGWIGIIERFGKRVLKRIEKFFEKKAFVFIREETDWMAKFFEHNIDKQTKRYLGCEIKFPTGLSEREVRNILERYLERARMRGGENPERMRAIEEALKKLDKGGFHGSILGIIFAPHTSEQRKRQECGEVVTKCDILGAASLDIIGIVDPGVIDLLELAASREPQALPLHAIGSDNIPGFPGGVRPSPSDPRDYPNFRGPPSDYFQD